MWISLIILCVSFYIIYAEDNIAEIEVKVYRNRQKNGDLECTGNAPGILLNAPFRIYVNYSENIYRSSCRGVNRGKEVLINKFWKENPKKGRIGYVSKTSVHEQMTVAGNWTYSCEIYTHNCMENYEVQCYYELNRYQHQDKGVSCSFNVHILEPTAISTKPTGYLSLNNQYNVTSPGNYTYHFYDREPMNFVCYKTSGGYIKLSYTTKDGNRISTDFQPTGSTDLYMKLTAADNNNTLLECSIANELRERENVIDLFLIVNPRKQEVAGFEVNGLVLPINRQIGITEYYYEYKYYPEEQLEVAIVKDDHRHGDVACVVGGPNVSYNLTRYFNNGSKVIRNPLKIVLYEGQTNTSLRCTVDPLNNPQKIKRITIIITLIHNAPEYSFSGAFISGLSLANILMKYSIATSHIIHYDYIGDEALFLECLVPKRDERAVWKYNILEVVSNSSTNYIEKRMFKLQPHRDNTTIQCCKWDSERSSLSNVVTSLVLVRRKAVQDEMPATLPPQVTIGPAQETTPEKTEGPGQASPKENAGQTVQQSSQPTPVGTEEPPTGNVETPLQRPPQRSIEQLEGKAPVMNRSNTQDKTTVKPQKPTKKQQNKTTKTPVWRSTKKPWRPSKKTTKKPSEPRIQKPIKPATEPPRSTDAPVSSRSAELAVLGVGVTGAADVQTTSPVQEDTRESPEETGEGKDSLIKKIMNHKFGIIAAAIVVIVVIIAVILLIAVDLKKRKQRHRNNPTDIDYQNLPQHNEGPMPIPTQWEARDDATLAVPSAENLESLYSKPVPKYRRSTKTIDPTYAEARDSKNAEPTYASVQSEPARASVQKVSDTTYSVVQSSAQDPTYAEVGKTDYQNLQEIKEEKELNYAEIYNTNVNCKSKPALRPKPVYSQIMAKKAVEQKYSNVQDIKRQHEKLSGSLYANTDTQPETEPAYCEVNVKKRSARKKT